MASRPCIRPGTVSCISEPDSSPPAGESPRSVLDGSFSRNGLEETVEMSKHLERRLTLKLAHNNLPETNRGSSQVAQCSDIGREAESVGRLSSTPSSSKLSSVSGPLDRERTVGSEGCVMEDAPALTRGRSRWWSWRSKKKSRASLSPGRGSDSGRGGPGRNMRGKAYQPPAPSPESVDSDKGAQRGGGGPRRLARTQSAAVSSTSQLAGSESIADIAADCRRCTISGEVPVAPKPWFLLGGKKEQKERNGSPEDSRQPAGQASQQDGSSEDSNPVPPLRRSRSVRARDVEKDIIAKTGGEGHVVHSVSLGAMEYVETRSWSTGGLAQAVNATPLYEMEKAHSEARPAEKDGASKRDISRKEMDALLRSLRKGSTEKKSAAAASIRSLARTSAQARVSLAEAGAIPPLVALMSGNDVATLENATLAICNLAIGNSSNKTLMVEAGAIPRLATLLRQKHEGVREAAVAAILTLAAEEEHNAVIGGSGTIPLIIDVLNTGSKQGRCDAAHALHNLLACESNRAEVLRAQPVPGLLRVLKDSPASRGAEKAVAVLYTLTAVEEGRVALIEAPTAVAALMAEIQGGSERGREVGVMALLAACSQSRRCCNQAMEMGAIPILLELCQEAPPRVKVKLRTLLKCLERPGSAPVVMVSPSVGATKSPKSPISPNSPSSPKTPKSPASPCSHGSLQPLGSSPPEFFFNSENNIVREMVQESRRGAMKQIRLRANLPEI